MNRFILMTGIAAALTVIAMQAGHAEIRPLATATPVVHVGSPVAAAPR